jgi:hypothetical protein
MNKNLQTLNRLQRMFDMTMFYSISVSPYRICLQGELNKCNIVKIKSIDKRNRFKHDVSGIGAVEFTYANVIITLL